MLFAALREARAKKNLDLMRTAHYLLLTQQWTAVEARVLAICRCGERGVAREAGRHDGDSSSGLG